MEYNYSLLRFGRIAGQSIELTRGHNTPQWSLALTAEIPIGNSVANAQLHRAIVERVQRLATRAQRALAIRQEVYNAVDQFNQNWQRILAVRNEAVLAGRTCRSEHRQFELGVRTSTDFLLAAASLAAAQLTRIIYELQWVSGKLCVRRHEPHRPMIFSKSAQTAPNRRVQV